MNIDLKISPKNLLEFGHMEDWDAGASAAPTGFVLAGAGASVARDSDYEKHGTYSAAVTRSGAETTLYIDFPDYADYKGKKMTLACWVRATVADRARIAIDDGVDDSESSYHTGVAGDGTYYQLLTVTRDISPSATQIRCECQVNTGNTTAWFDSLTLVEGPVAYLDISNYIEDWSIDKKYRISRFTTARMPGLITAGVEHNDITLSLKGKVVGTTSTLARTAFDSLLQYFSDGEKDIYIYDDRFFRGYLTSESHNYIAALKIVEFSMKFSIHDPFMRYIQTLRIKETISASPTTFDVDTNGSARTRPRITFSASGNDITSCALENLTTGQVFSFAGTVTDGDDLVVDCDTTEVLNDNADAIANFTGDFLHLVPGDNQLTFTGSNCIIKVDWIDKWI